MGEEQAGTPPADPLTSSFLYCKLIDGYGVDKIEVSSLGALFAL